MAINIDRSNTDQFYRYKMPRLVAKVEGSGNGIKTVVANIAEIAKSLDRPASYPLKYFGYELGAQTMIDTKNDRFIVNGAHEAGRLQEMLDGFIKKFVLCPQCNNPETTLSVNKKKEIIRQTCAACGYQGMADMKNKLSSYIIKNPPTEASVYDKADAKLKKEKDKAGKGTKDDKKENGKKENGKGAPGSPTAELDNPFDIPPPVADEDEDDDWGEGIDEVDSPTASEDLSKKIKALIVDADADKTEGERLDLFFEFVKKQKGLDQLDYKKIRAEVERLELDDKAVLLLVNALFDEHMLEQIPKYQKLFLPFVNQNERAQKFLIGGFEMVVGEVHADALMPKCMRILKAFYDADLLEEDVLVDWFDKPSKKYQKVSKGVAEEIRKKVEKFIVWLKEADPETDSEEDDSDDGIEVVKTNAPISAKAAAAGGDGKNGHIVRGAATATTNGHHSNTNGGTAKSHVNGNGVSSAEDDGGDDLDIDAI